jgi:hypothetical protein
MVTRGIALVVGAFYLVTGLWSFFFSNAFYGQVATYAPFNLHLFHDLGAFQVGLGLALVLSVALRVALLPALAAVLGASMLHLLAHFEDLRLGGHPATDIPVLALVALALAVGTVMEWRRRPTSP